MDPAHWHLLFELLAYSAGFQCFRWRRRIDAASDDGLSAGAYGALLAGAILGAALGSRLGWWLQDPVAAFTNFPDPRQLMLGKTVLGGLLGAVAGVEIAKKLIGLDRSTGDVFVWPIVLALAIGRIGCHLGGLGDHTAGLPSDVAWAFDYGDGVPRHPAALYEILCVAVIAALLARLGPRLPRRGDRFRLLMACYCLWRFAVEFIKPAPYRYAFGLSGLQWLSLAGLAYYAWQLLPSLRQWSRER